MKIDIKLHDVYAFSDVASLVDQDDFLEDVVNIRKKFGFDPKEPNENWEDRLLNVQANTQRKENNNVKNKLELLNARLDSHKLPKKTQQKLNQLALANLRSTNLLEDFYFTLQDVRRKFRRPLYFTDIIQTSIIKGIVQEDDYKPNIIIPSSMYEYIRLSEPVYDNSLDFDESEIVLVVYPQTKKKDVLKMWSEAQTMLKANLKKNKTTKLKNQIRIHRNIYWYSVENNLFTRTGKDWDEIVMEWKEQCPLYMEGNLHPSDEECVYCGYDPDEKTFRDAIKAYSNWLKEMR